MILMAVHASRRDQSEAVQRGAAVAGTVHRFAQHRVLVEAAVLDGAVDRDQRLMDEPPGADGEMAHLGVALLAGRNSHRLTAGVDRRVRPALLERVELGVRAAAMAFPYGSGLYPHPSRITSTKGRTPLIPRYAVARGPACASDAAATMTPNSSARRLTPPTSAPSMSGSANSEAALAAVTLPP